MAKILFRGRFRLSSKGHGVDLDPFLWAKFLVAGRGSRNRLSGVFREGFWTFGWLGPRGVSGPGWPFGPSGRAHARGDGVSAIPVGPTCK